MAKYAVVFGRDGWENGGPVLLYGHVECMTDSIEEAKRTRKCSGDLVFDLSTREVVQDGFWLHESERQPGLPDSGEPYPVKAIKTRVKLSKDFWDTGTKKRF